MPVACGRASCPATRWWRTKSCSTTTPGRAAQRLDDPAVRVGVVADVVERDVGAARRVRCRGRATSTSTRSLERRQQQRAVVGDAASARAAAARSTRPSRASSRSIARVPGDRARRRALPARPQRSRLVLVLAQPAQRARELVGASARRRARSRGRATTSSGPPASVVVTPASRTGTPRTAPSRSPRRPARSRRRGSARRGRRAPRRSTRPVKRDAAVEAALGASCSSRSRSGPSPAITTRSAGLGLRGLDQQVDPLRAVEPVRPRGRSPRTRRSAVRRAPAAGAAAPRRRARSSARSRSATLREVAKSLRASPSATRSSRCTSRRERAVLGRLGELAELGAVELVRLPELVQEPDDLVRVPDAVRRELRRDHEVDRAAVRLLEVEQPPEERLRQHPLAGVPLERHRDELGLVAALAQLAATSPSAKISAPPRSNGTCGMQTAILMGGARARRRARASSSTSWSSASFTIRCSAKRGLDVPAHELAQDALDLEATAALRARPALERLVGADGPEPLGQGAHGRL